MKKISTVLLSLILATGAFTCVLACGCGCTNKLIEEKSQISEDYTGKVQCPVMKTWFQPGEKTETAEYNGKTYHFCCGGCKPKFLSDPEKYISEPSKS